MNRSSIVLLMILPAAARADWPQWRGPNRDGVLVGFTAPRQWPEKLTRQWQVTVGTGHACPVVQAGRVYQFTRVGADEVARCLELNSGQQIWRRNYPAPYTMNSAAKRAGKGPKSTPVVSSGKLFTLGISGTLSCFDIGTGDLKWRRAFAGEYAKTSPLYGTAMSPVVEGGLVIAHVGGHDDGALTAFDAETGAVRWRWDADGPAYTSPLVVTLGGVRQMVTESQNHRIGVAFDTGELLWRLPFTTPWDQNIVTPLAHNDTLIFSGLDKETIAIRVTRRDGTWSPETVWRNAEVPMYMSSPVLSGDLLFGLTKKRKGQFFCLDARTGKLHWTGDGRQGDNAALVRAGPVVLALTTKGRLVVFEAVAEGLEATAHYKVADSQTWAHPVVVGNRILIKDHTTLAAWAIAP